MFYRKPYAAAAGRSPAWGHLEDPRAAERWAVGRAATRCQVARIEILTMSEREPEHAPAAGLTEQDRVDRRDAASGPHLAIPGSPPPQLSVLIAEGLPLVRALLRDLLTAWPGVMIAGEATTEDELLACTRRLRPDLVLLDWSLGGIGALEALRALDPAPLVIVLIAGADPEYCAVVLAQGGAACLPREHLHRALPPALRQIMASSGKETLHG